MHIRVGTATETWEVTHEGSHSSHQATVRSLSDRFLREALLPGGSQGSPAGTAPAPVSPEHEDRGASLAEKDGAGTGWCVIGGHVWARGCPLQTQPARALPTYEEISFWGKVCVSLVTGEGQTGVALSEPMEARKTSDHRAFTIWGAKCTRRVPSGDLRPA